MLIKISELNVIGLESCLRTLLRNVNLSSVERTRTRDGNLPINQVVPLCALWDSMYSVVTTLDYPHLRGVLDGASNSYIVAERVIRSLTGGNYVDVPDSEVENFTKDSRDGYYLSGIVASELIVPSLVEFAL